MMVQSPQIKLLCIALAALLACSLPNVRADEPAEENAETSAEAEAEIDAEQPTEPSATGRTPGYELPPEARSPFLPADYYREQEDEQEEKQGLTPEFVQKHVILSTVMSRSGSMKAIINRTLLEQGDALTLERGGEEYSLQITEIKRNPPMAVLTHRDQRFTVTPGQ